LKLGGHSLLAVRLFARSKAIAHQAADVTIFQSPHGQQLARAIEQHTSHHPIRVCCVQPEAARRHCFWFTARARCALGYANLAHPHESRAPTSGIQACGAEEFPRSKKWPRLCREVRAFHQPDRTIWRLLFRRKRGAGKGAAKSKRLAKALRLLALLDCGAIHCGYEKLNWRRPRSCLIFARNLILIGSKFSASQKRGAMDLDPAQVADGAAQIGGAAFFRKPIARGFDLEEVIDLTHVSDREMRLWRNHLGLLVRHVSKRTATHDAVPNAAVIHCSVHLKRLRLGKLAAGITIKNVPARTMEFHGAACSNLAVK